MHHRAFSHSCRTFRRNSGLDLTALADAVMWGCVVGAGVADMDPSRPKRSLVFSVAHHVVAAKLHRLQDADRRSLRTGGE